MKTKIYSISKDSISLRGDAEKIITKAVKRMSDNLMKEVSKRYWEAVATHELKEQKKFIDNVLKSRGIK